MWPFLFLFAKGKGILYQPWKVKDGLLSEDRRPTFNTHLWKKGGGGNPKLTEMKFKFDSNAALPNEIQLIS